MQHKAKVKLARHLRNRHEEETGVGLFNSLNWRRRKWAIAQRVKRQETRAKYHSEIRKGLRKKVGDDHA